VPSDLALRDVFAISPPGVAMAFLPQPGPVGDMEELRRLAAGGSRDADDALTELADEHDEDASRRRSPSSLSRVGGSGWPARATHA
jgi:hypothetical protein